MIDPIWESKYSKGHRQYYPWDVVVSFIKRNMSSNCEIQDMKVLELGCGTGGNLSFLAREGFQVFGIDGSQTAIKKAKEYLNSLGLSAKLNVCDFSPLLFEDNSFDFIIDRAALTHVGISEQKKAIQEVNRTLKQTGKFFYSPYSKSSTSYQSGINNNDGLKTDITSGSLINVGQVCCLDIEEVKNMFTSNWKLCSVEERNVTQYFPENNTIHSEWHVIAEKNGYQLEA